RTPCARTQSSRAVSVSASGCAPSGGARQKPQAALQKRVTRKQITSGSSIGSIALGSILCPQPPFGEHVTEHGALFDGIVESDMAVRQIVEPAARQILFGTLPVLIAEHHHGHRLDVERG